MFELAMTFARRERGRGVNTSPFNARVVGWETANDDRLCGGRHSRRP